MHGIHSTFGATAGTVGLTCCGCAAVVVVAAAGVLCM